MCVCVLEHGSAAGDVQDLLTCGECLEEFPLSDIVRFIHHKVSHGGARCSTSSPPADDDDDERDMTVKAGVEPAVDECQGSRQRRHRSPSRGLLCDSSLPGDDGPAADNRLNGDADDCFNHRSTSTGQYSQSARL